MKLRLLPRAFRNAIIDAFGSPGPGTEPRFDSPFLLLRVLVRDVAIFRGIAISTRISGQLG
jgi:hypothetical protein